MFWLIVFGLIIYLVIRASSNPDKHPSSADLPSLSRFEIADALESFSEEPGYGKEADVYLEIADSLRTGRKPMPQLSSSKKVAEAAESDSPAVKTENAEKVQPTVSNPFELLENINILLFAGAFLVLISTAILVGGNYTALNDTVKMLLVLLLTGLFYGSGLAIYQKRPKLRSAGATFTAIGMVMVPLLGIAYHNLINPDSSGELTWLIVSIISVVVYALTARIIKHQAIIYALIFAVLSTLESGLVNLGGSYQLLAWASLVGASTMLALSHRQLDYAQRPFQVMAFFTAPITLFVSVVSAVERHGDQTLWQLAITLLLGAVFYTQMAMIIRRLDDSKSLFMVSNLLFLGAVVVAGFEIDISRPGLGYLLLGMSLLYALGENLSVSAKWLKQRAEVFTLVGAILTVAAIFLVADRPGDLSLMVGLGALIQAFSYAMNRQIGTLWLAFVNIAALPLILGSWREYDGDGLSSFLGLSYAVLFLGFLGLRYLSRGKPDSLMIHNNVKSLAAIGYFGSLFLSWLSLVSQDGYVFPAVSLVVAIILFGLSHYEKVFQIQSICAFVLYVSAIGLVAAAEGPEGTTLSVVAMLGVVQYGAGWLMLRSSNALTKQSSVSWRISGALGLGFGVLNPITMRGILSLMLLSTTGLYESYKAKRVDLGYISGGFLVLAIHWLAYELGIREVQVFAVLWAAYFATLALLQHQRGRVDDAKLATVLSLAALTLPLLIQSLQPEAGGRALALVLEAVGLTILGIAMRYRLVMMWGISLLIGSTLYQTQSFLFAIPKQVISLGLGVALLSTAVYYLARSPED